MKKKYLTYAGSISALILTGIFVGICLFATPFPFLSPSASIDPITDKTVDENNMMTLTGTTTLPENTYNISLTVSASPGSLSQANGTGWTNLTCNPLILPGDGGRNRWKGVVDISELQPADYTVTFVTFKFGENFTRINSDPLAMAHFTLADEDAGAGTIRKKTRVEVPYIRINPFGQNPTDGNHEITGITSLAPGTSLFWTLHSLTQGTVNSTRDYQGTIRVSPGYEEVHRWSVLPVTGALKPDRYQFSIRNIPGNNSPEETVSVTSDFEVASLPGSPQDPAGTLQAPRRFITIDTLPAFRTNDVYVITGTTSLPPGEDLMVEICPASFETDFNFSLDAREMDSNTSFMGAAVFSGATGGTQVVNGGGKDNLWAFRLQTYQLSPGRYLVNVSNDKYDTTLSDRISGDLFSSRIFTLGG